MATDAVLSRGYLATVDGVRGHVRATFARSAYVTVNGGPALVLHAASGGDHTPTSLCLATWPPATAIAVGDAVSGRAGHLRIGDLVLDVRCARAWRPAGSRAVTTRLAEAGSLDHPALRAADRRTGALVPALERAIAASDTERVADCVASLVGRGPGLTPSGDDALVGLLAVLHRLAPQGEAPVEDGPLRAAAPPQPPPSAGSPAQLVGAAVAAHLHRTGDISAHYLRLAIDGHFGELLVALCDAFAAGARDKIDAAAAAVAAGGATSGTDALLGVVSGLRLVAARRPTPVPA